MITGTPLLRFAITTIPLKSDLMSLCLHLKTPGSIITTKIGDISHIIMLALEDPPLVDYLVKRSGTLTACSRQLVPTSLLCQMDFTGPHSRKQ